MVKEIYEEVENRKDTLDLFSTGCLYIEVTPIFKQQQDITVLNISKEYKMSLRLNVPKQFEGITVFKSLNKKVKKINKKLNDPKNFHNSSSVEFKDWNIFYLYKELIQLLAISGNDNRSKDKFNYFRGQYDNWELSPSLFRKDTKRSFLKGYDVEYSDIAREYPEMLRYVPYSKENSDERAENLAMLQHYGMRTSLLDITKNPFIALQFMVLGNNEEAHNQVFELYCIDEDAHSSNNIFVSIVKNSKNKRIKAQKGAFFNYDRAFDIDRTKIMPIPRLRIEVKFDTSDYERYWNGNIESAKELIDVLRSLKTSDEIQKKDDIISDLKQSISVIKETRENELQQFKENTSRKLNTQVRNKLVEFYYLEKNLFPDFDKYIQFVQKRNIETKVSFNPKANQ